MKRMRLVLAAGAVLLCVAAAPTMADKIEFEASYNIMSIDADDSTTGGTLTVNDAILGSLEHLDDDGNVLQSNLLPLPDFVATLDFVGSGDDYSASGQFSVSDVTGTKIQADFESYEVTLNATSASNQLEVRGWLSPSAGNSSILVGEDDQYNWHFEGTGVSLADNIASYDNGTLVVLRANIPNAYSLEDVFAQDMVLDYSGSLTATVVPVPAAALLGLLGMGVAGLRLRKES